MNIKIIDWIKSAISKADNAQATADALAVKVAELHPVGSVITFAANSAPSGCLLCNGAAVSRTTYAKLFEAIGTTYGSGDGSTTFNLPNLTDRFIQGSGTAGTVKGAGLPGITGSARIRATLSSKTIYSSTGAIYAGEVGSVDKTTSLATTDTFITQTFGINASLSSSIYGNSTTVQPPALTMRFYIKY